MTELVPDAEVKELRTQADDIVAAANALVVADDKGMGNATELLGWIASAKKGFEGKRKMLVKPLNDHVKTINTMFKEYTAPLEAADSTLRGKVLSYRQEQERIRREEEARLRKLAEEERARLEEEAEREGTPPPPPMPIPQVQVRRQAKTTRGDFGTVSAKKVWDFEIVDASAVPPEFLMVNEKAIRAAVKAGVRNIPGVNIYQKEELSVRGL